MEFIEATAFTRLLPKYLQDGEYRALQDILAENPGLGDVMQGTGGFRKVRWTDERRGKGKRGGLRIIYFYFEEDEQIWLLTLYGKNEADDLNKEQRKALQTAIAAEKAARKAKRSARKNRR
jgi:mRNA-degrading endonuclease RelE of RelBE toxin-antitoxin system